MNPTQLKKWKITRTAEEKEHVKSCFANGASKPVDFYSEFSLKGAYTTSLDPYVPIWALVPFFDQIVVGVLPHLKSESDFIDWYGVSTKQLLQLEAMGKVKIRVIYPRSLSTIPKYLNHFFDRPYPTTLRDYEFNSQILGIDLESTLKERFKYMIGQFQSSQSIDSFEGSISRALRTAQTVYLQLAALGCSEQIAQFEVMAKKDLDNAFKWLEICRLFYVSPEHYSLGGIHSVADNAIVERVHNTKGTIFPSEVGKILVEAFKLYKPTYEVKKFSLEDCISVYQDSELARSTLIDLSEYVQENRLRLDSADALRSLIANTRKEDEFWMRTLRIAAATTVSAAVMPFEPIVGVLAGLGFTVFSESESKPIDKAIRPIIGMNSSLRTDPKLTLLLRLDDDVKKSYSH